LIAKCTHSKKCMERERKVLEGLVNFKNFPKLVGSTVYKGNEVMLLDKRGLSLNNYVRAGQGLNFKSVHQIGIKLVTLLE